MEGKYFSIIDFCQTAIFCKRKKSEQSLVEEHTAKSILEQILRQKYQEKKNFVPENTWLSTSSPNLYAEVNGNFSNKPTICIKTDKFSQVASKEIQFKSLTIDYKRTVKRKQSYKKENKININSRRKSFKHDQKIFHESLPHKSNSLFTSCPNLDKITRKEEKDLVPNEDSLKFDNVDEFTTNLFLSDVVVDESNFDLVSLNFD